MVDDSHDIRLVIASVEGTILAPDGTLTARTRAAVRRLADAGIAFTLVTSRPPERLRPLVDALELDAPMAALGGSVMVRPDLSAIVDYPIDRRGAETALAALAASGVDVWVYTADQWLVRSASGPRVDREAAIVGIDPVVVETFDTVLPRVVRIVGVSDDPAVVIRTLREVQRRCGSGVLVTSDDAHTVVISDPNGHSGEVVVAMADAFDVPIDHVAAIGSGPADVPMLTLCGLGVALGNARSDVRKSAARVAPSNADEGFATTVEQFVLGAELV